MVASGAAHCWTSPLSALAVVVTSGTSVTTTATTTQLGSLLPGKACAARRGSPTPGPVPHGYRFPRGDGQLDGPTRLDDNGGSTRDLVSTRGLRLDEGFAFRRRGSERASRLAQTRTPRSDANPSLKRGPAPAGAYPIESMIWFSVAEGRIAFETSASSGQ